MQILGNSILFFYFFFFYTTTPLFVYDRAAYQAQQGSWETAQQTLAQLLAQDPNNYKLLYDNGIAAYNQHDFIRARAYFVAVLEHENAADEIKKLAAIEAGNCAVSEKMFDEALAFYDKALIIDPDNEYAQHNKDVVLALKQQQEQQQQKDGKSSGESQENNSNDQNSNQQSSESGAQSSSSKSQDKKEQDSQNQKEKGLNSTDGRQTDKNNQEHNSPDRGDQSTSNFQSEQSEERRQPLSSDQDSAGDGAQKLSDGHDESSGKPESASQQRAKERNGNKREGQKQSKDQQQQKRDAENKRKEELNNTQREQERQDKYQHEQPFGEKDRSENNNQSITGVKKGQYDSGASDQAKQEVEISDKSIDDPWIGYILQQQEQHDKNLNRQMMMRVNKQAGHKHEQANNW